MLRHAWSVRLLFVASALAAGAIAVPLLAPAIPNEWLYAYSIVVFLVVFGALVARFFAQKKLGANLGD